MSVATFAPDQEAAWLGLLSAHAELTRALDGCLTAQHGLTLNAYELLSRLDRAEDGHLRMSELAGQSRLSLSRVSRVVDALCDRGVVERRSCPGDSRVVHATITAKGRELAAAAQETFFVTVEERFLNRLTCDEVTMVAGIFGRLVQPND